MRKFYALASLWLLPTVTNLASSLPISANEIRQIKTDLVTVTLEKMYSGLDTPWAIALLPDNRLLVTQRDGELVLLDPDNPLEKKRITGLPDITAKGQGGLLDVVLDTDFTTNKTIYFTFSHAEAPGKIGTAIAKANLNLTSEPKLENLKILYSMSMKDNSGRHFGSRIVQAKDGTLFFTIGDRGTQPRAQNPFDPAGSVIRINTDGTIPADNPDPQGKNMLPEIWSIGHRNAQGATLNPVTQELWTISHGAKGGDEINIPQSGKNYGWPTISYGRNYSGSKIGVGQKAPGLEQPIYYWDPSIAPSGADFHEGKTIPEWTGNLFVGALKDQSLIRLTIKGNTVIEEERLFENELGRIRDVRYMHDGALWIATNDGDGSIYRILSAP